MIFTRFVLKWFAGTDCKSALSGFTGLQFAEVKAMDGTLYNSTNQGQLAAMITAMAGNPAVRTYGGEFIIATTADTAISPNLISTASSNNINIIHAIARFRMSDGGQMQINFHHGNTPSLYFSTVK